MAAALGIGYMLGGLAAGVVTALKGKWGVLVVGIVAGFAWFFGAVRMAKPDSWWARRFYDEGKRERAAARHASDRYRAVVVAALVLNAALVLALPVVGKGYRVPSAAMEPTLSCAEPGIGCSGEASDRIYALRFGLGLEPRRGDVVAYRGTPDGMAMCGVAGETATFVHRIVGLEGETVEIRSGRIVIDGEPLDEPNATSPPESGGEILTQEIPAGHVFVAGDNRDQSCDSRVWGPLPEENLVARVVVRYWPLGRLGTL